MKNEGKLPIQILLVEDDEHDQLVFSRTFRQSGVVAEIVNCTNAPQALELLQGDAPPFDVVVIDHHLPGIYGLELCEELINRQIRLPLIILTGYGTEQVAVEALKAGVYEYIVKDPENNYLSMLPVLIPDVVYKYGERLARERAEEDFRQLNQRNDLILKSAGEGIFGIDRDGKFIFVNPAASEMLGYETEEIIGRDSHNICHHSHIDGTSYQKDECLIYKALKDCKINRADHEFFWRKDGSSFAVEYVSAPTCEGSKVSGAVVVFKDITELKKAEAERLESQNRLAQIVEGFSVPTFIIDENHIVTHWNRACANITGVPADEVIGTRDQWRAFYPSERPVMADLILESANEKMIDRYYGGKYRRSAIIDGAYEAEDYFPHFGAEGRWLFFTAAQSKNRDGKVIGAIETLQDISERKQAEEALRESEHRYYELSITDGLTGLYNSRHFYVQIQVEMERAHRYQRPLSLMMLDVDNFKLFNDTYGHLEGDRVLHDLAVVIRDCIRLSDSGYRYGGEEFVALLPETDRDEAIQVAERLRSAFAEHVFLPAGGGQASMTISIGVTCFQPGDDIKELIRRADAGTYAAKRQGKNCVVFNKEMLTGTTGIPGDGGAKVLPGDGLVEEICL